jgi:hypothetical protein
MLVCEFEGRGGVGLRTVGWVWHSREMLRILMYHTVYFTIDRTYHACYLILVRK